MLRGCSLMTLMTHAEMELAKERGCDFIHTWHSRENTTFLAVVVPELVAGFMFYRGDVKDGEEYEDAGCVHLRYYLDREKMKNARVYFKGGKVFESPKDNTEIIYHLTRFEKYPGREILRIDEHKR